VTTVGQAVERMEAIAAVLPTVDGLACFNRLYLIVTRAVATRIGAEFFADPAFVARLDVVFANLYFAAADAWNADRSSVARCWAVLLGRRSATAIAPLQFALAGMNAHINRDLAMAVVATCRELGTSPADGSQHDDYQKLNALLGELEPAIQESFEEGVLLELDRHFGGLDNLAANFSIEAAREVAWGNAETLWSLRNERFLSPAFLDGLDRLVAFAGRTLLLPLPRI